MAKSKTPKRKPAKASKRSAPRKKTRKVRKKRKRGPASFRSTSKLFKSAGQRTRLQNLRNDLRSNECLKKQRYGFRLLWKTVPADMKRYRIGEPGSYDQNNCHRGVCWGWPKECRLTNQQARTLYLNAYEKGTLTIHQLIVIRKSLSFAWELTGGAPGGNYPAVKEVWKLVIPAKTKTQTHHVLPDRIPTVSELRKAFRTEWTPDHPMSFVEYCQGLLAAYDLFVFGLRSTEDVRRVKHSHTHQMDWINGWHRTAFKGGRAKLCGVKKGSRPWSAWRSCHCKKGKHVRPPAMFTVDKDGNPCSAIDWNPLCPVAVLEFIFSMQWRTLKRCYPKFLKSGAFGKSNIKDIAALAIKWFVAQGIVSEANAYNRNAGRKSLARWCGHLRVPYRESFQLHGDLFEVWAKNYETEVAPTTFKGRVQTTDPWTATKALRRFANFIGCGRKVKARLSKSQRFHYHLLASMGKEDLAEKIAQDLPTDDEESSCG